MEAQAPGEVPGLAAKLAAVAIVCCLPQSQLSPEALPRPLKLLYNDFPPRDSVEDSTEASGRRSEEFPGSHCSCTFAAHPLLLHSHRLPDRVVQGQGPGVRRRGFRPQQCSLTDRPPSPQMEVTMVPTSQSCEGASGRQCGGLPTGTCTAQEDQEKEKLLLNAPLPLLLKACRGSPNKKRAHSCCAHLELKGHPGIQGAGISESRGTWGLGG